MDADADARPQAAQAAAAADAAALAASVDAAATPAAPAPAAAPAAPAGSAPATATAAATAASPWSSLLGSTAAASAVAAATASEVSDALARFKLAATAPTDRAYTEAELAQFAIERRNLLNVFTISLKALLEACADLAGEPVTNDLRELDQFCLVLENVLRHGLRRTFSFTGRAMDSAESALNRAFVVAIDPRSTSQAHAAGPQARLLGLY